MDVIFDAGFSNPGLAAWVYDPEVQAVTANNRDIWNGNNLLNVNPNDEAELQGYASEVGAVNTAQQYGYPELANVATGNSSAAAIESGRFLGMGSGYVKEVNRVTGELNNAFGLDIEDAQAANEAVVQSQLARGKFNEAIQSAQNARGQSMRYEEKISRMISACPVRS